MRIKHFKYYVLAILADYPACRIWGSWVISLLFGVAKFYGDRAAAICYSFDDGLKNQADIRPPTVG
jgi:hypothetical protein